MSASLTSSTRSHFRFWAVGILGFFVFLYLIRGILLPFVVGLLAAYFLNPAVRQLSSRGMSRSSAAGIITFAFFLVAVTACSVLVPMLINQLSAIAIEMPAYVQKLQTQYGSDFQHYISSLSPDQVESFRNAAASVGSSFANMLGNIIPGMLQSGLAIVNLVMLVFLTPVVVFYLLRDWEEVVRRVDAMLPRVHAETIRTQLCAIDRTLSGFIRGQTNVCLIMATYYGIALSLLGLRFGLGMGILTGFMLFIPFVGYACSLVICLIIALVQFGWGTLVIAMLVVFGVGAAMESGVITPKLVGDKVGLHPIWIIFGMLAGAALFGFVGILISLPVTAVLGVLVRFAAEKYMHSTLYSGG